MRQRLPAPGGIDMRQQGPSKRVGARSPVPQVAPGCSYGLTSRSTRKSTSNWVGHRARSFGQCGDVCS